MTHLDDIEALIRDAFSPVEYPGDWCLRGSDEGDEPRAVEAEFRGKSDWRVLDPRFLDEAPRGLGSALSFFSDEALHFYLPAYMLADLRGLLQRVDVVFCLTHGLDKMSGAEQINPRRYGPRTWSDYARYRFSVFDRAQAASIAAYLAFQSDSGLYTEVERVRIAEALQSYWLQKAA